MGVAMESEGDFHFKKKTNGSYESKRGKLPVKKILAVFSTLAIVAVLLWQSPAILSFFQSSLSDSSNASYTSLFIRSGTSEPITLGDTEYRFIYLSGFSPEISIHIPFKSDLIEHPKAGNSYERLGIEVKVVNIGSDYLSDFIEIKVRPTVDDYMFTTFRYTKVDIPLQDTRTVNISSGIIDKTNQYTFKYLFAPSTGSAAELAVSTTTLSKRYAAHVNLIIAEAKSDFDIEIRTFEADSNHIVIYVKPMY